ncbi:MAG: hydrolase [Tissierellia bacterium]|nr:hydrolase [Tissierellia bacterium]
MNLSYQQALELLQKYNKEPFHVEHGKTVGEVMAHFAETRDPERVEFWRLVGLLHDIDFEMWPEEHCVKAEELLRKEGISEEMIHAITSHGHGMTGTKNAPELEMEKVLFAVDELTGIIGAARLMRPSKSTLDMDLKSVKKKFKDKKFAAGCDRTVITQGAELLGMELPELMEQTLAGMQKMEKGEN